MNIVASYPNIVPLALQPAVEAARRDTLKRELIPAAVQGEAYAKESQVGSEKDRARSNENRPVAYQSDGSVRGQGSQQYVTAVDDQGQGKQKEQGQQRSDDSQANHQQSSGDHADSQTQSEQKAIKALEQRDKEVRTHEQAHQVTGGRYASTPDLTMEKGPDGEQYAIGGQVEIDISPESTPDATIRKMQQVQAAALAPLEPSSQDRAVAAKAARLASEARAELKQKSGYIDGDNSVAEPALAVTSGTQSSSSESAVSRSGTLTRNNQDTLMLQRSQVIASRYAQAWQTQDSSQISRYA